MFYGLLALLAEAVETVTGHRDSECTALWIAFLTMLTVQVPIVVGVLKNYVNTLRLRATMHGIRGDMQTVANKLAVKEAADARLQIPQHLDVHISGAAGQPPATPQPSQSVAPPANPPPAPAAHEQPPPPPQDSSPCIP